ncbi:MAG: ankyrin repeat domain-containing protein [Pyrinomonadaceae bacterium]
MIQPRELRKERPMKLSEGVWSTTTKVWEILSASAVGDLAIVKQLGGECPQLLYAQFNYAPPIHFAVREGHVELVKFLLDNGAHDPGYGIYPFLDSLQTVAGDRGFTGIVEMLDEYQADTSKHRFKGDNGEIDYQRSDEETRFEKAVDAENYEEVKDILDRHPEFALDDSFFWSEGILLFAAKENNRKMADLLMSYGAKVPSLLKWTQFYYFERLDGATYMIENGMDPNTMSYQRVTILHDMAQKGSIEKAELLLKHGADIDPIDLAYQSTPLGLAARWGRVEMAEFLMSAGADPRKGGAAWSTPMAWASAKGNSEIEKLLRSVKG